MLQPTSWTRPLQLAVVAMYAAQALFAASVPFWFITTMTQWANTMNERYGAPTPPPGAQAADPMNDTMTAALYVVVVIGIVLALAAIVMALKQWPWAHYAISVFLGLQVLFSVGSLLNVLVPTLIVRATPPAPVVVPELTVALAGVGLLAWMIVAAATRGPWGMRRVS
ncbi:MAG: hypothetical protein E6J20_07285 [Chloroflexi bacterium]|nr:MAG: hypothetical protein E6J20_07285 [Chloroflexota bacterium]